MPVLQYISWKLHACVILLPRLKAEGSVGIAAVSFASYVSIMSKTGVLVSRHGPMLANALFLPPGEPPCRKCAVLLPLLYYLCV